MSGLEVLEPGPQTTVQDLGRPGHADVGVTTGGACDRTSLRIANRLVGNPPGAAALEALLGRLTVRAQGNVVVAMTGAPAELKVDGRPAPFGVPVRLTDGQTLAIGMPAHGLRTYLSVRGGLRVPLLYGSASASPAAALGPASLVAGDRLEIGDSALDPPVTGDWSPASSWGSEVLADAVFGPRDDWFTKWALQVFARTSWQVTGELDRVGIRLSGPELDRQRDGELLSEGMVRGSIQVPPNGQPVVFLADHPTTGGYPVIAVVSEDSLDRLGQLRPGDHVRFRAVHRTLD